MGIMHMKINIPDGIYDASATSNETVFKFETHILVFSSDEIFVKGVNCKDTVTVKNGKYSSRILGDVSLKQIINFFIDPDSIT